MPQPQQSVMVIDDEIELGEIYSRFLELSGFNCVYYTEPDEALNEFVRNFDSYSLIITDLKMPSIDGLEFTRRIRQYSKTIKVVLVTAFLTNENLEHAEIKESRIDTVIEKPFRLKDLEPIIKEISFT